MNAQSPITEFKETIDYVGCDYVRADFYYVSSSTADCDSVCWDFGDGKSRKSYTNGAWHNYSDPGTYTVTLTIWLNGIESKIVKPNLIKVYQAPVALFDFIISDSNLIVPLQVEFKNQSILRDGNLVEYSWMINEKTLSNDTNFSYIFKKRGVYDVVLLLNDNNGCQAGYYQEIVVKDSIQINEFEYITSSCNDETPCNPEEINYKIENNTLKLFGQISANCCTNKTAVIIDKGDSIQIPTFEGGPACTCNCLFCFEINIPDFNRDSCVVVFGGRIIHVNSINTSLNLKIEENLGLRITPNPFKGSIVVELDEKFIDNSKIEIFNLLGELVYKQPILNKSTHIDMSYHHKGIYLLRLLKDEKIIMTEKLIKK